jgi:hypothetical protein
LPPPICCFKDRLADRFRGHLRHPAPDGRNTHRTLTALAFREHDPFYRIGPIRLVSQCFFQCRDEYGHPFLFLKGRNDKTVNPGAPPVGAAKDIVMTEDVSPIDLVV